MNEDQIDLELKCMICNDPFQSPVNCIKCGQTFCQECINKWNKQHLSCPSCRKDGYLFVPVITRIVLNQLNRLLVQCSLCQETNIERCFFPDHISLICPKQIIPCPEKCNWKGCRENLEKHFIKCQRKHLIQSQQKTLCCFRFRNLFSCIYSV